ncbi:WYL domain-containing protein [Paenibacillus timonensis]|nr:WYL domain-containing protein [Paenibacillus timonensis]MUG84831.1 WYL domain-containing protein [Paenibacillus timonensis]
MKKAERLNQELIFLSNKHEFRLKDLMEEFHISKRTALRDLEELAGIGLPYYTESGRYGGYKLINQTLLPPVYFNKDEIRAIFFALNALSILSSTPFEKSYPHIRQKLLATLPKSQQEYLDRMLEVVRYYSVAPIHPPEYLALILTAIMEEKVVRMIYSQYETIQIDLQVYELFYRNGIWFCSAYEVNQRMWGTYRCDYMSECEILEEIEHTHSLKELKISHEEHKRNYHNIPFRAQLTSFGKELFLKHHYPNMVLEEKDGISYLTGGYNEAELDYMTHYLCSYGKHVKIEFPEQLKKSYLQQLEEIKSQYL